MLDIPVICIGNFTAGGTGKTPLALWLAEQLQQAGERPVFLTRGYGGTATQPCLVDLQKHSAADVGDEAVLLAAIAPTICSADRAAGLPLVAETKASVLIMDDGLQNPALTKDITIAVVDAGVGIGNGYCIPAGPLRAPIATQMPHVSAVVLMGEGDASMSPLEVFGHPMLRAIMQPDANAVAALAGKSVLAFAGIGRPEKFFETIRSTGADLRMTRAFADHHPFTADDLAALRKTASEQGLTLVTTTKDYVRLPADADDVQVLPVTLSLSNDTLMHAVQSAIARKRNHRP